MRSRVRIPVAVLLIATTQAAMACGVCTDQSLSITAPLAGIVPLLALAWLASMGLIRRRWSPAECDAAPLCPSRKLLIACVWFLFIAPPVFWVLSSGSMVGSAFLVGLILSLLIFIHTGTGIFRSVRRLRIERLSQVCFLVSVSFFVLLGACFVGNKIYARSTGRLIAGLRTHIYEKDQRVIPALLLKGEEVIDPLIAELQRSLRQDRWYGKQSAAASAAYCLGRIGGPKAATCLGEIVRTQVSFAEMREREWQRTVCCAYGAAAGAAAVPDLIALYQRMTDEIPARQRWVILSALAMTRSRSGMEIVLNHMDELLAAAEGREPETAEAILLALFAEEGADAFFDTALAQAAGMRGPEWRVPPHANVAETWRTSAREIRHRWASAPE